VQGAHDVVTFDHTELREVGTTVRALALHDEVPEFDLVRLFLLGTGASTSLVFSTANSFNGETLEEVVEEFVEFSFSPRRETTTEEERVRPVHASFPHNFLQQGSRNLESKSEVFSGELSDLPPFEIDDQVGIAGSYAATPTDRLAKGRGEDEERLPPRLHRGNEVG